MREDEVEEIVSHAFFPDAVFIFAAYLYKIK